MEKIVDIRRELEKIDGAIAEYPSEHSMSGDDPAVETLWSAAEDDSQFICCDAIMESPDDEEGSDDVELEQILEIPADIDEQVLKDGLGGGVGEEISKAVEINGVDALAWYASFHQKGVQWGIYIPTSSIAYVMVHYFADLPTDISTKMLLAIRVLHQHELMHFAIDYAVAQWELMMKQPCYIQSQSNLKYTNGYSIDEEMLAVAQMFRSLKRAPAHMRVRGSKNALRNFVKTMPAGYKDGEESSQNKSFYGHLNMYLKHCFTPDDEDVFAYLKCVDVQNLCPVTPRIDWRYCPLHIIHDEERLLIPEISLSLLACITDIHETHRFKKELGKLPQQIQAMWGNVKEKLSRTTLVKGLDFKPWGHDSTKVYSVRLNDSYRAHLVHDTINRLWSAQSVGTHKSMGHG